LTPHFVEKPRFCDLQVLESENRNTAGSQPSDFAAQMVGPFFTAKEPEERGLLIASVRRSSFATRNSVSSTPYSRGHEELMKPTRKPQQHCTVVIFAARSPGEKTAQQQAWIRIAALEDLVVVQNCAKL
jgi:hypothetical protein